MSPLVWIGVVWGVVTAILIILLIYRSTLTMHEDDQLFLDESQSQMEQEQIQLMKRVNKISPYLKVLGALSGAMILVMAGMAIYQGLNPPQ
jgi:CDP-diglyceride synthetase